MQGRIASGNFIIPHVCMQTCCASRRGAWRGQASRKWGLRHDRIIRGKHVCSSVQLTLRNLSVTFYNLLAKPSYIHDRLAAAAGGEGDPAPEDDSPPLVKEDWRAFRSRLMAGSGALQDSMIS